jgi:hypothetical protein
LLDLFEAIEQMTDVEIIVQISIAVITTLATLAAAYFGARFAFDFQNRKNTENEVNATVKAANMAIFALMRSHHELTAIKKQFIDPNIDDEDRHFSILPSSSAVPHLDLEFNELSFLLSSNNPNHLNELALTQSEINATIDVVNARSKFHLTEFQPLLELHHQRLTQVSNLAEMEEVVGIRVTHMLKSATEAMVVNVSAALVCLGKDADLLYQITKQMYPAHGIVRMTFKRPNA